ncbi:TlpA family protein disulfide reductase [Sphingobacterium wenxiniae]|uniref:AhpC/TSA family protein n=1 Tax=Sphingobacterium wenxiniae TaxID=683125 RepID=A0A1I6THW0_9SPHI|nr:TlpA disulfide reductase family protein [Sphingobacterium wenxiniae]SFS88746.1 AhpC/TSA family protein [Sphingobacterium wenxiniae]
MEKINLKNTSFLFLLLLSSLSGVSQTEMRNINIGHDVSEIIINGIHDAPFESVILADYTKDKLLVLDFWATWCVSCVHELPKLDTLQKEFAGQLQIITVTSQSQEVVRGFFDKRAVRGQFVSKLPKIFADTTLKQLFPHNIIPHYVWIKDGKVVGITEKVEKNNILEALRGRTISLQEKVDIRKADYDRYKTSLLEFFNGRGTSSHLMTNYSFLTRFVPELGYNGGYSSIRDSTGNRRITVTNLNLLSLYRIAYGRMKTFINFGAIDVLSTDSLVKIFDVSGLVAMPIIENTSLCYEVVWKDDPEGTIFEKIQQDIKVAFPQFEASLIPANDTCLVIERLNENLLHFTSVNTSDKTKYTFEEDCIVIENCPMDGFRTALESLVFQNSMLPVVDQTGFTGRFDIKLCGDLKNLAVLNKSLLPYGLQIVRKKAEHLRLVITQK